MPEIDLDRAWRLDPQVALRPERFGALAYHFGTRRLSFLKDHRLHRIVSRLAECSSARTACAEAGISEQETQRFAEALSTLAANGMISPREPA